MFVFQHLREDGLNKTIQHYIKKYLGIEKIEDEINCLYYFFNHQFDIKDLSPTKDYDLRILQRCDVMLLGIFDKLCRKHNLTYWIEYGTLLGAVRHKGFIPWDDDTDLAMPRDDYNRAVDLMRDELKVYGITIEYHNAKKLSWIGLSYQHEKTGIWADIAPMDLFLSNTGWKETENILFPALKKYQNLYRKKSDDFPDEYFWNIKKKTIFSLQGGNVEYFFHGQEFLQSKLRLFPISTFLPTCRIMFEDVELNAPAIPDRYLSYVYSKNYMSFPHSGIEKHGGVKNKRKPLKMWAKNNNVNMQDVYNHLYNVYNKL